MKRVNMVPVMAALVLATMGRTAYCDNGLSYDDTVQLITKTMIGNTSVARQERYGYIKIDRCILNYKVFGTFPVGTPYEIKFDGMDFSSLNRQQSTIGRDYTDFIILNFSKPATYRIDATEIPIHSVVINTFDGASARTLFDAFHHLGELCGAGGLPGK